MGLVGKLDAISSASVGTSIGGSPAMWTLLEGELNAFITAVNANPGNAARQLTLMVAPSAATADAFRGFTLRVNHPTLASAFCQYRMNNSTTLLIFVAGSTYTAGATNGGLGTITNTWVSNNVTTYGAQGVADVTSIYDDTEGQEFFLCTQRISGTSAQSTFLLAKDTRGDWCMIRCTDADINSQTGQICVSPYGPATAYTNFDLSYSRYTNTTFNVSLTCDYASSTIGVPDADPVTNKSWIRLANPRLAFCNFNDVMIPLTMRNNEDWVTVGGAFAINMTGIV